MILGVVDAGSREALIRLFVKSPSGMLHDIEAAIDTGFTEDLTLPADLISALGLPFLRSDLTRQSDGGVIEVSIHDGAIL